jgi:MYXO-CTERM domain-containing protein
MRAARWYLGFGLVSGLFQVYLAVTGPPEYEPPYRFIFICIYALFALMGVCGLVLRRRSARSTVYATENGVHDPQDTGNDQ